MLSNKLKLCLFDSFSNQSTSRDAAETANETIGSVGEVLDDSDLEIPDDASQGQLKGYSRSLARNKK